MAYKKVTVDPDYIKKRIKIHLSIIGRRLNTKPGDKNYSNLVLTENEDDLIGDYFKGAVSYLASQFPEILVEYLSYPITKTVPQPEGGSKQVTTQPNESFEGKERMNDANDDALSNAFSSYVLSYCIGSYLAMVNPDLAKKYQTEAADYLSAVKNIIYSKNAPSLSTDDPLALPEVSTK